MSSRGRTPHRGRPWGSATFVSNGTRRPRRSWARTCRPRLASRRVPGAELRPTVPRRRRPRRQPRRDPATCGSGVIGDIQHSCNGIGGRAGRAYSVAGNTGLPLGENGFLNVSFEYGQRQPDHNRSIPAHRPTPRTSSSPTTATSATPPRSEGSPLGEDVLKLSAHFGHHRQGIAVSECAGGPISSGHEVPFHVAATTYARTS